VGHALLITVENPQNIRMLNKQDVDTGDRCAGGNQQCDNKRSEPQSCARLND
jgi:hypothetical protein